MNTLEIRQLRKTYASGVEALKGIDLDVKSGEFFALLGSNGAGKSTLIGIISSIINRSSGEVRINGYDLLKNPAQAKKHVGIVPQEFNFNVFEPVIEILINDAGYYGIPAKEARRRAEKYLRQLDIWDKHRASARELSGGMKRRLMIARALIHEPKLLILDEPTAGVDIEIRRTMWNFLREVNKNGVTIILTTHYLEEAENLCQRIAIIDEGTIVKQGLIGELVKQSDRQYYVLSITQPKDSTLAKLTRHKEIIRISDQELEVEVSADYTLGSVFSTLSQLGIEVQNMRNKYNRLEELFLKTVTK